MSRAIPYYVVFGAGVVILADQIHQFIQRNKSIETAVSAMPQASLDPAVIEQIHIRGTRTRIGLAKWMHSALKSDTGAALSQQRMTVTADVLKETDAYFASLTQVPSDQEIADVTRKAKDSFFQRIQALSKDQHLVIQTYDVLATPRPFMVEM